MLRIFYMLLIAGFAATALAELQPLTMKEVALMLRSGYSSESVLQEVTRRHVSDPLDEANRKSLVEFGGSPLLINTLASGDFTLSPTEAGRAHQEAEERAMHQEKEAEKVYRTATQVLRTQQAQASVPGYPVANSLQGKLVVYRNGTLSPADDSQFEKKKLIAFYFSAHWCAPCRKFTPQLVDYYNRIAPDHPEFELVFVSYDRSRFNWETYVRDTRMPWLAVAYEQLDSVPALKQAAGESIPSLILVDDTGHLLATSYEGTKYVGPEKVLAELEKIFASKGETGAASNQ
ncbi:MAG: thioredoxin-like domain-containing protein [Chthoniobacterales bacterium]